MLVQEEDDVADLRQCDMIRITIKHDVHVTSASRLFYFKITITATINAFHCSTTSLFPVPSVIMLVMCCRLIHTPEKTQ